MKFNRLVAFQNDTAKLSRYRMALGILYELGIDQLLGDMGLPLDVDETNPNVVLVNALQNQRTLGYRQCIANLFSLDSYAVPDAEKVQPDYGALEKLVKEGKIKPEDMDSFLNGI